MMMKQSRIRRGKYRRRALLKIALLMLPALFWTAVFTFIAGATRPPERIAGMVPDAAQLAIAMVCPLLALMLGLAALRQDGSVRASKV